MQEQTRRSKHALINYITHLEDPGELTPDEYVSSILHTGTADHLTQKWNRMQEMSVSSKALWDNP